MLRVSTPHTPAHTRITRTTANNTTRFKQFSTLRMSNKPTIDVKIVSDIICPWCYMGQTRFRKAVAQLGPETADVRVTWLPFFLDPSLPSEGTSNIRRLEQKFGRERLAVMFPRVKELGLQEGIHFNFDGTVANTLNAHRLSRWAQQFGKQDELMKVMFKYYHEQTKNLGDLSVLQQAAAEAGLDAEKAGNFLRSADEAQEVKQEVDRIHSEYGVSGVPYFIFNDKFAVSGGQEPAVFLSVLNKILSAKQ